MHLQGTGTKADQPNMFTAATELVSFLVCLEFEETFSQGSADDFKGGDHLSRIQLTKGTTSQKCHSFVG